MSTGKESACKAYVLFPLTPLHAGTGRAIAEAVDLPVQKDSLGYPVLWSSSLKGAFRSTFRRKKGSVTAIEKVIFGPEIGVTEDYASAITVLEARLLAMPVRSLKGIYAFVTTPYLLKRAIMFFEHLKTLGVPSKGEELRRMIDRGSPVTASKDLLVDGSLVLAEEVIPNVKPTDELTSDVEELLRGVNLPINVRDISSKFVIVDDDDGKRLIRKSLFPLTRIALDYTKKVVKPGALWTEEYVPEMTLLYTAIITSRAKMESKEMGTGAQNLLMKLLKTLEADEKDNFYLILGGHETIGKGIVKFCVW